MKRAPGGGGGDVDGTAQTPGDASARVRRHVREGRGAHGGRGGRGEWNDGAIDVGGDGGDVVARDRVAGDGGAEGGGRGVLLGGGEEGCAVRVPVVVRAVELREATRGDGARGEEHPEKNRVAQHGRALRHVGARGRVRRRSRRRPRASLCIVGRGYCLTSRHRRRDEKKHRRVPTDERRATFLGRAATAERPGSLRDARRDEPCETTRDGTRFL